MIRVELVEGIDVQGAEGCFLTGLLRDWPEGLRVSGAEVPHPSESPAKIN